MKYTPHCKILVVAMAQLLLRKGGFAVPFPEPQGGSQPSVTWYKGSDALFWPPQVLHAPRGAEILAVKTPTQKNSSVSKTFLQFLFHHE